MKHTNEESKAGKEQNKDAIVKPDPKTLHTTDPQDEMEGPISSLVQNIKDSGKNDKSKKEADKEKDRKM